MRMTRIDACRLHGEMRGTIWEGSYAAEPFDFRLTMLRMMRSMGWIVLFTLLGTCLFGGGYYVKNVLLGEKAQYEMDTPLESIAFGVPTITTDKSGFGQWILSNFVNSIFACGVKVVGRGDSNYSQAAYEIANQLYSFTSANEEEVKGASKAASETSQRADWKFFISAYDEAFKVASRRRDERQK